MPSIIQLLAGVLLALHMQHVYNITLWSLEYTIAGYTITGTGEYLE